MKIGIVGAGAIGLYYGARLARAGEDCHFLVRSDCEAIRERGIEARLPGESFRVRPASAYRRPEEIGLCDAVVVALKATANEALPALTRPLVGEGTVLLTLQNGLGNDDALAALYPSNPILGGLCFICLNRVAPGVVENYLAGSVAIGRRGGPADAVVEGMARRFRKAGVECRVEADLRLAQWKKLVWNIPFNGLAIVAGGVPTDRILADERLREEAQALMEETIAAAGALGLAIEPTFADAQMEATYKMGAYKPSSLVDFLAARPIEVEAIWGEPLRRARAAGASAPRLGLLHALLAALDRGR